jgi:hypothetical protein
MKGYFFSDFFLFAFEQVLDQGKEMSGADTSA